MIFWILGGILAFLVLALFAILIYCFIRVFYYVKPKQLGENEYDVPTGGVFDKHHDQLIAWAKASRELPHEDVCITSFDDLTLRGKYYECNKNAPIEIMFNGYRGNAERDMSGGIERCFKLKRNALVVNQRGCGNSEGKFHSFGINEKKDCLKWVDFCIEKFGKERRTEISVLEGSIEDAELIPVEDVVISRTHFGYVKRIPVAEYKAQHRGGKGITGHKPKEEDFVTDMFVTSTHDDLLFFTSLGKVYSIKGFEIPEASRTSRGRAIINILPLVEGEKVNAVIPLKEGTDGFIAMATRNGLIKKTALSEFASIRKTGKIAINLNEGDELISVQFTSGSDEILIGTAKGKCIRFFEGLDEEKGTYGLKPIGRDTQGVKAMDLADDDYLIAMSVVKPGCEVLTITSNGYGKLSSIDDYRLQNRAGKGVKAGAFNEKTGDLVCLKFISSDEDVMMISDNGIIIRVQASEMPKLGRDTQGVIVMRLNEGKVSTVAVVPHEDEEIIEEGEESAESAE